MAGMQQRMQHYSSTEYCTGYLHLCDCSAPQVRDGTAVYTGRPPVHCYLARAGLASSTPAEAVTIQCVGGGTVEQGWMNGLQSTLHLNYLEWLTSTLLTLTLSNRHVILLMYRIKFIKRIHNKWTFQGEDFDQIET